MTAFGNGRVWAATYEGHWADTVRRDLIEFGQGAVVRCGSAGAAWKVVAWQELSGDRVGVSLAPVAAHSISPAVRIPVLPMPQGAE